jgi:hypothetical protein
MTSKFSVALKAGRVPNNNKLNGKKKTSGQATGLRYETRRASYFKNDMVS